MGRHPMFQDNLGPGARSAPLLRYIKSVELVRCEEMSYAMTLFGIGKFS